MGGKCLNEIKSIYVEVKGGGNICFRKGGEARRGCIISPWHFSVYTDSFIHLLRSITRLAGHAVQ